MTATCYRPWGTSSAELCDCELPSWWTVDSTPGAESVTMAGQLILNPQAGDIWGLLIQPAAGFDNNYNAFLRVIDEFGTEVLTVDNGGFDMKARSGQMDVHVLFTETDTANLASLSSRALGILAEGIAINLGAATGIAVTALVPTDDPLTGQMQIYYDKTPGAAKLKIRAKDDNGLAVVGEIALA